MSSFRSLRRPDRDLTEHAHALDCGMRASSDIPARSAVTETRLTHTAAIGFSGAMVEFTAAVENYDRFMGRYATGLAPKCADAAGVRAGMVLDLGCGLPARRPVHVAGARLARAGSRSGLSVTTRRSRDIPAH